MSQTRVRDVLSKLVARVLSGQQKCRTSRAISLETGSLSTVPALMEMGNDSVGCEVVLWRDIEDPDVWCYVCPRCRETKLNPLARPLPLPRSENWTHICPVCDGLKFRILDDSVILRDLPYPDEVAGALV